MIADEERERKRTQYESSEMRDWFAETHGMPFQGILICWEHIPKNEHLTMPEGGEA